MLKTLSIGNIINVFIVLVFFVETSNAQKDKAYFSNLNKTDSLASPSVLKNIPTPQARINHINRVIEDYLALNKKAKLDCGSSNILTILSLLAYHSKGLAAGVSRQVELLALPVDSILSDGRQVVKQRYAFMADVFNEQIEKHPFRKVILQLQRQSDSMVRLAKVKLDWQAILLLSNLAQSDMDFRVVLPEEIFKDTLYIPAFLPSKTPSRFFLPAGKWLGMKSIDSAHFTAIFDYIQGNGFPGESKTGCYCYRMWPILLHSAGLLAVYDSASRFDFVQKWKILIPILHTNTIQGEFPTGWYKYIYEGVLNESEEYLDKNTTNYFAAYKIP
ncbi:MAG: hypothetical protein JSS64_02870 [Bacteroidetes bacterium]|nr:hypothetical protein [Bacteroidota bacterium]